MYVCMYILIYQVCLKVIDVTWHSIRLVLLGKFKTNNKLLVNYAFSLLLLFTIFLSYNIVRFCVIFISIRLCTSQNGQIVKKYS